MAAGRSPRRVVLESLASARMPATVGSGPASRGRGSDALHPEERTHEDADLLPVAATPRERPVAVTIEDRHGLPLSTAASTAAERYQEGMDRLLAYAPGAGESFAAALAHASCGDGAAVAALTDALRALAAAGHPTAGTVALPLVEGIAAFAAGDVAGALACFEPIEADIHRMGGSHAQWEVIEETMVVCYLRLGRLEPAGRLLGRRLARRPSRRDQMWLEAATTARPGRAEVGEAGRGASEAGAGAAGPSRQGRLRGQGNR
jgi:hypothetical protein